jgi:hypothetical protein
LIKERFQTSGQKWLKWAARFELRQVGAQKANQSAAAEVIFRGFRQAAEQYN